MVPICLDPPKRKADPLWWDGHPREGFTVFCAQHMQAVIPLDDVSDEEVRIMVRRQERLDTVRGLQEARSNGALRRAIVLSRN